MILSSSPASCMDQTQAAATEADQHSSNVSLSGNNGSSTSCLLHEAASQTQQARGTGLDSAVDGQSEFQPPVLHSVGKRRGRSFSLWPTPGRPNDELRQGLLSAATHAADSHVAMPPDSSIADAHDLTLIAQHSSMCSSVSRLLLAIWHYFCSMAAFVRQHCHRVGSGRRQAEEAKLPISTNPERPFSEQATVQHQHQVHLRWANPADV